MRAEVSRECSEREKPMERAGVWSVARAFSKTAVSERYDDERGLSHARDTAPPLDRTSLRMVHSSPGRP
jgi:hypothetical protein